MAPTLKSALPHSGSATEAAKGFAFQTNGAAAASRGAAEVPPADTDLMRLASQTGISLGGSLVGRGLNFLGYALLARILTPVDFGLYAVATAVLQILETVARLGLSNGIVRLGSKHTGGVSPALRELLTQSVLIAVASGLAAGVLLFIAAPVLATSLFGKPSLAPFLQAFAAALPLLCGLRVVAAATRLSLRTKYSVYAGDLIPAATHLVLLGLLLAVPGWWQGAVAARVASFALAMVAGLLFLTRLFPGLPTISRHGLASARRLLSFSIPTAFASILMGVLVSMDRVFLGIFREASEVGVYQAAAQVAVVMTFLLAAVNTIFAPLAAGAHHRGEIAGLNEAFRVSTRWGLYLSLPLFLAIGAAPGAMLSVVYGSRFTEASVPLLILMAGQLANVATGCAGSLLNMTGHPRRWLSLSAGAVGMNLTLNALLVPRWGAVGAAAATAAAAGPLYLVAVFQIRRLVGLWPYDRTYWKGFRASVWTALALAALNALDLPALPGLAVTIAAATCVFAFALWREGLEPEDRLLLGRVTHRLGLTPH